MFELRWMIRSGWDGPDRVLQYRILKEKIVYSGAPGPETNHQRREQVWSEWVDVPEVKEKQ